MRFVERIRNTIGIVVAFIAFGGFIWGTYSYLDSKFAKAADMKRIEQRLDGKILEDRVSDIQKRLWTLEERYYKKDMPESVKEEYRNLKEEKNKLERYMKEFNTSTP
ncbi:MAG: hypothetical protein HY890_07950 [Deltaproteobacteria bacterium]|nr:hypothetical protein [Deltaproteobacteria bacterium]